MIISLFVLMFIQLILMLFLWKMIRTQKKTQEAFDELFIQIIKNHKEIYVGESKVVKSFHKAAQSFRWIT